MLHVEIHEARHLPRDRIIRLPDSARHKLKPLDKLIGATEKLAVGERASNPYVVISVGDSRRGRTSVKEQSYDPVWNEVFDIFVADQEEYVWLTVKDADSIGAPTMGLMRVPVAALVQGQAFEDWFPLIDTVMKPLKHGAAIRATISFRSVFADPDFKPGSFNRGVPYTYLPMRDGCRLTLYNDAHQEPDTPPIQLPEGGNFQPRGAWTDIHEAICNARHLIYIAGWSIYDRITLIRDSNKPMFPSGVPTLGELLKKKAEEGVRVLLLVWDDQTSLNSPLLRNGLMATHDEDTRLFFSGTTVECALVPREGGTVDSVTQKLQKGNMFTHHQKSVVVDSADPRDPNVRHMMAFVGGLDLCDGRYDTPQHSLFHTLKTIHSDDYHQACCLDNNPKFGGPRQPWHDIHCQLQGPVATDVLVNFVQRWLKQAADMKDKLLPLMEMPHLLAPDTQVRGSGDPSTFAVDPADPEAWQAQLFRSIDSDSAAGLPPGSEASRLGLDSGKGKVIDAGIHSAYVTAIRRAQRFIYIENQYFLGSSHAWPADRSAPCRHLIPLEIALKIVSKINAGERFAVYVVLPMYSEGDPESGSVQEILRFQTHTMRMMYGLIGQALEARRSAEHPRDYLNFFCLGNRETQLPSDPVPEMTPPVTSYMARAHAQRRFLIYVHSKMMIVDDEYIIIGSANINQRSQDGTRDTELAVGALQPRHTMSASGSAPHGQVHGFRLNLWKEHTNGIFDSFYDPSSLKCARELHGIAKVNWDAFVAPEITDLFGHLLLYPIQVNPDGSIQEMPGAECFPDSAAHVFGATSVTLPDILTT
ncbi:g9322 [Coccomyxa elongata]